MNRKIKAYQALIYIVAFWLAAALLLLGPGKLLDSDRTVAGNEAPAGTAQVRLDQQIQQVLIAEGSYLRYLDLYVTSSDSIGKYYHLLVYDENNEILINREFELAEAKSRVLCGFRWGLRRSWDSLCMAASGDGHAHGSGVGEHGRDGADLLWQLLCAGRRADV